MKLRIAIWSFIGLTFLVWFGPVYFWLRPLIDLSWFIQWGWNYGNYWTAMIPYALMLAVMGGLGAYSESLNKDAHKARGL